MFASLTRRRAAFALAFGATLSLASASTASAYELKVTTAGQKVRWASSRVAFVIDPSVNKAISGASQAVGASLQSLSGASGAPSLDGSAGSNASKPAVDGKNTVLYANDGYAPAGGALAVTILSYEESTGNIVDADVVINGNHTFAVLPSGAKGPSNVPPSSNEGGSNSGDQGDAHNAFDLQHVVSHELGHALGLKDADDSSALMYGYSKVGDALVRGPQADDLDGLAALYSGGAAPSHESGCGGATVAGRQPRSGSWALLMLVTVVGALLARGRRARLGVPVGVALMALIVAPGQARSASAAYASVPAGAVAATVRIASAETQSVDGLFQTTLSLTAPDCLGNECPILGEVQVWGGTLGGITQQVGETPAPHVNDRVLVAFSGPTGHEVASRVLLTQPQ